MLDNLNSHLRQLCSLKVLIALLIAYGIYMPIFFFADVPFGLSAIRPYAAGTNVLDVEFFYTATQAYDRLTLFGEPGRAAYLNIVKGDLIYPILLGGLLAVSICLIVKRLKPSGGGWQYLALLPLVYMVCDYCENSLLFVLLLFYPTHLPTVASVAGFVTLAKNIIGMLSFATLALGLFAMAIHHFRPQRA
ncbi:MAG: hypothetical protein K0M58_02115 [Thiobacillus sp.]|nr:hypothetical protein [Thiobacillus sp.]MDO9386484.1 hypothetical protein [Thiobacillus sp.]